MPPSFRAALRSDECKVGTSAEPEFSRVKVGKSEVLVARLPDGEAVAFAALCPHQETPLDAASFFEGHLRCGRHLYLYDVHSGENIVPARTSPPEALCKLKPGYLPVHRVEEREGWIWVAETPEPAPPAYDPAVERGTASGAGDGSAGVRTRPGPAPGPAPAPAGPVEHAPETVAVRVGEEFELVLPTSPRPAHLWRASLPPGIAVVWEEFAPDAPPRHVARLVARAGGEAVVRFTYATPWDSKPAETRSFVIVAQP